MTDILSRSIFIGGSPCSGKSTLAARLARELGLAHYKCDDHFSRHLDGAAAVGREYATLARSVTHEYIFMRSDQENLAFALGVHGEEFEFILRDLRRSAAPVIAEGCSLLPAQVAAAGIPATNVFYLVPDESFHREKYKQRTWAWDRLAETSDPERAFENWMRRDALMARHILAEAETRGFTAWRVGHGTDFEELYAMAMKRAQAIAG